MPGADSGKPMGWFRTSRLVMAANGGEPCLVMTLARFPSLALFCALNNRDMLVTSVSLSTLTTKVTRYVATVVIAVTQAVMTTPTISGFQHS
nr:MAG TPA: hypothetical protein [Caudoviricetes sp.]